MTSPKSGTKASPWADWQKHLNDYLVDSAQRSIIFLDILRKRGNNYIQHIRSGQPPVLTFNYEMILNAKHFERPVNYALVRISERRRKDIDPDFRTLVRLAKKWRNRVELKPLKSFAIELIMAHVLAKNGKDGSIEKRFRDFLLYIAQSGLKEVITFPENGLVFPSFTDPVVILDPVCNINNVASRISEDERKEIVAAALAAWETANFASMEDDIEIWKELFGPRFKVEEEE